MCVNEHQPLCISVFLFLSCLLFIVRRWWIYLKKLVRIPRVTVSSSLLPSVCFPFMYLLPLVLYYLFYRFALLYFSLPLFSVRLSSRRSPCRYIYLRISPTFSRPPYLLQSLFMCELHVSQAVLLLLLISSISIISTLYVTLPCLYILSSCFFLPFITSLFLSIFYYEYPSLYKAVLLIQSVEFVYCLYLLELISHSRKHSLN